MDRLGGTLKAARTAANVSLSRMSALTNYTAPYLSQLENGKRNVLREHVAAYEAALGVEGLGDDMDRRTLLAALPASAALEPLERLLDGLEAPKTITRVGRSEVEAVQKSTAFYSSMDLQHGGRVAVDVASGALRWAVSLLNGQMSTETRLALNAAVGSLSDRIAWAHHDSGLRYQTGRMAKLALRTSAQGNDPTLSAHIRLNVSSFMERYPDDAADALTEVCWDNTVHPLERSNVCAVRARHLGNAGKLREARNTLAMAEDFLGEESSEPIPSWASFLSLPHLQRVLGRSYYSIGDLERSADRFEKAAEGFGPDRARGRAQVMVRLGFVYLRQGRVEDARRQAQLARPALENINSSRASSNLADLEKQLAE